MKKLKDEIILTLEIKIYLTWIEKEEKNIWKLLL